MPQTVAAADIGDIDAHPITNVRDVGEVAAIFWDHAVDQQNLGANRDEAPRDRGADEAETSGNQHLCAGIGFET